MRISSQSNGFIYQLPSDFIPMEVVSQYNAIIKKNWIQYDNILDYLNSTIKSVSYPGISLDVVSQPMIRGKMRYQYAAKNVQDIFSTNEISVVFRSVDNDLNYMIIYDIFIKHYLDTSKLHINPFMITQIDIHKDALYTTIFSEILLIGLSDNLFDYSQQRINAKEFTLTFKFNFMNIEFLLNKSKILELSEVPKIIQKLK